MVKSIHLEKVNQRNHRKTRNSYKLHVNFDISDFDILLLKINTYVETVRTSQPLLSWAVRIKIKNKNLKIHKYFSTKVKKTWDDKKATEKYDGNPKLTWQTFKHCFIVVCSTPILFERAWYDDSFSSCACLIWSKVVYFFSKNKLKGKHAKVNFILVFLFMFLISLLL